MARESFVFDRETMELVPRDEFYARRPHPARSDVAAPRIIRDYIEPGVCQVDGKVYDSRSRLQRAYDEYTARTGQKVMTVSDGDYRDFTAPVEHPVEEKAIDTAIKTALEKHAA
jgi:hypothetical protein